MATVIDNEGVSCSAAPICAICSTPGETLYRDLRDPTFGSPGNWSFRRCSSPECGVVWVDPMPLPDGIPGLYSGYYTHSSEDDSGGSFAAIPLEQKRPLLKKLLSALFPRWQPLIQHELSYFAGVKPGTILDVGCGAGTFLRRAVGAGWKAVGIDFDAQAIAVAARVEGAEAYRMDLFDASLDGRQFDGILLDNVIEHLLETPRIMARCAELLRPGGRLVMITPNARSVAHETFGPDWRGLETPRHLQIFTGKALGRVARDNGFPKPRLFTMRGGHYFRWMAQVSIDIARLRGREPPAHDLDALTRAHERRWWTPDARGEFLVLVAHKP